MEVNPERGASPTRRAFLLGCAGCAVAAGIGGCTAVNPAPLVEADPQGTVPAGEPLGAPGDQMKVRLPQEPDLVLVWRTAQGYGAASIVCTHRGSEVHYNPEGGTLDCPSHGSRFDPEGKVVHGPAARPLRAYRVSLDRGRLRIQPA